MCGFEPRSGHHLISNVIPRKMAVRDVFVFPYGILAVFPGGLLYMYTHGAIDD